MKTNVIYGRNRYLYVLIWNIDGSSTRDRNCVCLSTRSAALNSWKDIQFLLPVEDPLVFHINVWRNLLICVLGTTLFRTGVDVHSDAGESKEVSGTVSSAAPSYAFRISGLNWTSPDESSCRCWSKNVCHQFFLYPRFVFCWSYI